MSPEAKGAVVEQPQSFDEIADKVLDKREKETPSDTSSEKETNIETEEDTGADQSKKASPEKEVDEAFEKKLSKIKEILGDDEKAIQAYIKTHGYHKDPAWQKLIEKSKVAKAEEQTPPGISKDEIEKFQKVTSSPEYIRASMRAEGYTEEAINEKLKELGHKVGEPSNLPEKIMTDLNITPKSFSTQEDFEKTKAIVEDVVAIADKVVAARVQQILEKELSPIKGTVDTIQSKEYAQEITKDMKEAVSKEGILDWEKEVEPLLHKFLDDNSEATQEDLVEYFYKINHSLVIDKLKVKGKKSERDETKKNLRAHKPGITIEPGKLPPKTGDFDTDFDNAAAALGIK